jgi:hypothetical protein
MEFVWNVERQKGRHKFILWSSGLQHMYYGRFRWNLLPAPSERLCACVCMTHHNPEGHSVNPAWRESLNPSEGTYRSETLEECAEVEEVLLWGDSLSVLPALVVIL